MQEPKIIAASGIAFSVKKVTLLGRLKRSIMRFQYRLSLFLKKFSAK